MAHVVDARCPSLSVHYRGESVEPMNSGSARLAEHGAERRAHGLDGKNRVPI
jgi:hypothetical protein